MKPFSLPKAFQPLSDEQLADLNDWLDDPTLTYKVIREKLVELHGIKTNDAALTRYNQRRELADQTIDHSDSAKSIRTFIALQNAEPVAYDTAGLALIQKRAFDAACAPRITISNLASLQRIFHYKTARAEAARKMAQIDRRNDIVEQTLKLRREESARRAARSHNSKSIIPNSELGSQSGQRPLCISPNPLPPEIVEENRRYAEKLRTGKIIFDESGPYIRDIELPEDNTSAPLKTQFPSINGGTSSGSA